MRAIKQRRCGQGLPNLAPFSPIVVLPTTIDEHTIAEMRAAGYVPVLCDDPSRVKVVLAGNDVVGGDLLMSALHGVLAVAHHQEESQAFATELYRRLRQREE